MKKVYALTPQQLHDHIQNTIRVFNEYALDNKMLPNNTYRISFGSKFYLYQFFTGPDGTTLLVKVGKTFGNKISEQDAQSLANTFFSRLDQIIRGQIVMTPDVANRDVYKSGSGAIAVLTLIKLIAAIAAIAIALGVLFH